MTGINTVLSDDPSLTARPDDIPEEELSQPWRVVLDSRLRMPPAAKLLDKPGRTLVLTGVTDVDRHAQLMRANVDVVALPLIDGRLDLEAVLQHLGTLEMNEVHLEAGAGLCGALLQAGLVDELVIYMAPHLMGNAARGLFDLPGLETLAQRVQLKIADIRAVGEDWRITATVVH